MIQPVENMQSLLQAPGAMLRNQPRSRFFVSIMVAKHLKPLHASTARRQASQIDERVGSFSSHLRDSPTQRHSTIHAEMRERCIQCSASDIIKVYIDAVWTSQANRRSQVLFGLVIN